MKTPCTITNHTTGEVRTFWHREKKVPGPVHRWVIWQLSKRRKA